MNKLLQKEKKYNTMLILVVIVIIFIVTVYTYVSQHYVEKIARYTVQQNSSKISNEVDTFISSAINSIQVTSYHVSQTMSKNVLDNPNEIIHSFLDQTPFNFIEYIEQDGTNTTDKGEIFDASDRVYYKEGIKGNTGIWVNYSPKYSKEYLLNFYTPLVYNNEIVGVLTGTIGSETNLLPLLKSSFLVKI